MLGTFANGRFEQYFEARTLAPDDIRDPSTSRQIAKRMRELHDGIAVLKGERDAGPAVWNNWDKWVNRAEEVVSWADRQVLGAEATSGGKRGASAAWRSRGFICGVEWSLFRMAVDMARSWLIRHYGGIEQIQKRLVFAHNDVSTPRFAGRTAPLNSRPCRLDSIWEHPSTPAVWRVSSAAAGKPA